ncbi:hypothetical protein D3C87_1579590 [compost metagenome]
MRDGFGEWIGLVERLQRLSSVGIQILGGGRCGIIQEASRCQCCNREEEREEEAH